MGVSDTIGKCAAKFLGAGGLIFATKYFLTKSSTATGLTFLLVLLLIM